MAIKLNATVQIKDLDITGRVAVRIDYLNGSRHYEVQHATGSVITPGFVYTKCHKIDLEVIGNANTVDTPKADPRFPLGTHVWVLPYGDFHGIVNALLYSSSGCVEYQVLGFVPGQGIKKFLLDAEVLQVIENQPAVESGVAGGSMASIIAEARGE